MDKRCCAQCGEEAEGGDTFCGHCGSYLTLADGRLGEGEPRRLLTAAEVNRRLGRVYLARGKRGEAVRAWRRALRLEPEDEQLAGLLRELEMEEPTSEDT